MKAIGRVVGVLGVVVAGAMCDQAFATSSSSTSVPDGSAGYHGPAGTSILVASIVVVGFGLMFAYVYHRRLLVSVDKAIVLGRAVGTSSVDVAGPRPWIRLPFSSLDEHERATFVRNLEALTVT